MAAREAWRKLKKTVHVTPEGWRLFKNKFELCMYRVEDRSPQEERDTLFRALPLDLKKAVMEEDSRRADREKRWVRFHNVPHMEPDDFLEDILTTSGVEAQACKHIANGFIVQGHTDEEAKVLISMTGL